MDINYGQENSARFAFTQPAPSSIPQSPVSSSRHSHTMSSESASSLFHHDVPTSLNFNPEASVGYSHPASAVHSPMAMSTFPPTSTSPFVDGMARHRGSSFTSPPITSPSRSGFETPITPSESLHGRTNAPSHPVSLEPAPGISFSTSDLVTMSVLEGIEASVKAAREAMVRGDRTAFQSRTQNVVSSADLLRGFGANHHYTSIDGAEPSFGAESLNFDAINLAPQSGPMVSPEVSLSPSEPRFASTSVEHSNAIFQNPQSFAHGLALLDVADPSRKRTISTATARAAEPDRAPKTQKTTPSRRESVSNSGPHQLNHSPSEYPQGQSKSQPTPWFDLIQDRGFSERDNMSVIDGSHLKASSSHARQASVIYTPSSLARNGVRQSRSSSYSSAHPSLSSFGLDHNVKTGSSQSSVVPSRPHSPESFFTESETDIDWETSPSRRNSRGVHTDSSPSRPTHQPIFNAEIPNASNLVSPPLKADMDRVFDIYLQGICSNLEAKDSKGEPIHQTLMPKKMAKMAESNDFRPFKFRIQAFTNAFMDTLAQHRMGEDIVAQKKVKAYLWHQQPLISRFNDDGKKSKSKGNHVWHIMAKLVRQSDKGDAGTWVFRPFERRIAGSPPPLAYVGLNWTWQPRIWDPQMPSQSIHVSWSSPQLPPWLTWQNAVLMGVPGSGDVTQGVDVTVEAAFPSEQREPIITSFHVQVSPHTVSQHLTSSKSRHALADPSARGRATGTVPLGVSHSTLLAFTNRDPTAAALDPAQVLRVVSESIRTVADAQSQEEAAFTSDPSHVLRRVSLARQQRVLVTTAEALTSLSLESLSHLALPSAPLIAAVATDIVSELAKQKLGISRTVEASEPPIVASNSHAIVDASIQDIASLFQAVVARAVGQGDSPSTELEVMMAAKSLVNEGEAGLIPSLTPAIPPVS